MSIAEVTINQVGEMVKYIWDAGLCPNLVGPPGIGKTAALQYAAGEVYQ